MKILSLDNKKIKNLLKLQKKSRYRKIKSMFVIEGIKEFKMAISTLYQIEEIFICPEIFNIKYFYLLNKYKITKISEKIFKKISYRKTSGGLIAISKIKKFFLEKINITTKSIILILDKIEKPGNLGSILRSVDAAGIDTVILSDPKTDIFNPNVIRSSIGAVFNINIVIETYKNIIPWLLKNKIKIITTAFEKKSKNIFEINFQKIFAIAIIFGSENKGLSNHWIKIKNENIKIPMTGKIDSLNISTALAIIIFEIIRQRFYNFNN